MTETEKLEKLQSKGKLYIYQINKGTFEDKQDVLQNVLIEVYTKNLIDKCLENDGYFISIIRNINAESYNMYANKKDWSYGMQLKRLAEKYDIPFVASNAWKLAKLLNNDAVSIGYAIRLIKEDRPFDVPYSDAVGYKNEDNDEE